MIVEDPESELSFHHRMMDVALSHASEALAHGEFPVGCIIVCNREIVSTGRRQNSQLNTNEIDHAEIIALRRLIEINKEIDLSEVTIYSTLEPCLMCYSTLLVNGVTRVVYSYEDAMGGGTNLPLSQLAPLYRKLQIEVTAGILRNKSLELFKKFFSESENGYLADTYLARYTLAQ